MRPIEETKRHDFDLQLEFDHIDKDDSEDATYYDELKCTTFLLHIMKKFIIPMAREVLDHLEGRAEIVINRKNLSRWRFTVAALFAFCFPIRCSTIEIMTIRNIQEATLVQDVCVFKLKDSKRTSKLLTSSRNITGKKKAKIEIQRATPIWCQEILLFYVEHIYPHFQSPQNSESLQVQVFYDEGNKPYGKTISIKDQLLLTKNLSKMVSDYLQRHDKEVPVCSTFMRSFFASITESKENDLAQVVDDIKEHTDVVKRKHYCVQAHLDAKRMLLRYVKGIQELVVDIGGEENQNIISNWLTPPFRSIQA
jgi:hypothetical protein